MPVALSAQKSGEHCSLGVQEAEGDDGLYHVDEAQQTQ